MPIYFDYNATTPLKHAVWEALYSHSGTCCIPQNPSSIHAYGRKAKQILEESRERVGQAFDIQDVERLFFTSSATESINTAIKGCFFASPHKEQFHLISTGVEHNGGIQTAAFVQAQGGRLHMLEVDRNGNISLEQLEQHLQSIRAKEKKSSILCSVMAANNETGKLYPTEKIGEICRQYDALLHVDAAQVGGKLARPFSITRSGASLVTLSSHKIGGPLGVGALYVEKGLVLEPLIHGGSQERKRRAGTYDLSGILGFSLAAELLKKATPLALEKLRNYMEKTLLAKISDLHVVCGGEDRLCNTSNLVVPGLEGHSILMNLDMEGVAISSGSACSSGSVAPSHVLLAMGYSREEALSSIRVSLGEENTQAEVDYFCSLLSSIVERIRNATSAKAPSPIL